MADTPIETARKLATLPRTGWLLFGIPQPDTVGDHSIRTAVVSMLLNSDKSYPAEHWREALFHDLEELEIGDLTPMSLQLDAAPGVAAVEPGTDDTSADRFERFLQAHEYAQLGATGLGALLVFKRSPKDSPVILEMVEQIQATNTFPQAEITRFYKNHDYFEAMERFTKEHGNVREGLFQEMVSGGPAGVVLQGHVQVTDVGCGTANLGYHLVKTLDSAHLNRIDINASALALEPGRSNGVTMTNYLHDFSRRWPIPTNSQDVVVIGEVLEHSFNPAALMAESARVLKDQGRLIITVPNAWHWKKVLRFLFLRRLERTFDGEHIRYFSAGSLKRLVNQGGQFRVDRLRPFSLHWPKDADPLRLALHKAYSAVPGCAWNYLLLATRNRQGGGKTTAEHDSDRVSGHIAFLKTLSRGKVLPFVPGSRESIFQAAFRVGVALRMVAIGGQDSVDLNNLSVAVILRACLEAMVGEHHPSTRAVFFSKHPKKVLERLVEHLQDPSRKVIKDAYDRVAPSREWGLVDACFTYEYGGKALKEDLPHLLKRAYGL